MASFCECGSLIANNVCTNKKCKKQYTGTTQYELKLFDILDNINSHNMLNEHVIKRFDGAIPYVTGREELINIDDYSLEEADREKQLFCVSSFLKDPDTSFVFSNEEGGLTLAKIRIANPKEARGRVKKYMPLMFTQEVLYLCQPYPLFKTFWGMKANNTYELLNNNMTAQQDISDAFWVAMSIAVEKHLHWNVYIKEEQDLIGITLQSRVSDIKELFKLRELPPDKNRRTALKHWVCSHQRRKPNTTTETELIEIEKYLRGATEFYWNGLYCRITPSTIDVETLKEIRARKDDLKC